MKHNCPECNKEFETIYLVQSTNAEPYTAVPWDMMNALEAYGTTHTDKQTICHSGNYLHFKFLHNNEERLVLMKEFDPTEIAVDRAENESAHVDKTCEEEGCTNEGDPCYMNFCDTQANGYYCDDHAHDNGFCPMCNYFYAGIESFDFSPNGLCEQCQDQLADELGEYDDYDEYDYGWEY